MKFEYVDPVSDWQYIIDFSHDLAPKPGFLLEIKVKSSSLVGPVINVMIHRDPIRIENGIIKWAEYHIRKDNPLASETFRKFAQKIVDNKSFW